MFLHSLLMAGVCALFISAVPAAAQTEPSAILRLGMVAPFTGDFAPYGLHIRQGVELAQAELKKKGIETELFAEDACLPLQVRGALSKLVQQDKINALVASYCVIGMVASESILEKAQIVSFQTSGGTKEILDAGDYLFTTAARTADEARSLADYAYTKLKLRQAAVLYLTTQWGEEFSQNFIQRFSQLGGKITGSATNPIGENNFRSELTKLRAGDADGLLLVHLASTLGMAIKQAREIGFSKQLLATTDAEEQSVIEVAGEQAEGLKFLVPEPAQETPEMRQFAVEFSKKYGEAPHPLARHAFDATLLAAGVLTVCGLDAVCAKERLYATKDYRGASGTFSLDADGGTKRDFIPKTVRQGRFVLLIPD